MIYGKPSNHADSTDFNNSLLQYAYQSISECRIPTLVAGDFNQPLHELPAAQHLLSRGYQEAFALHTARTGQVLPPTCRNATRNDTCLIDPALVPLWQNSWTLHDAHLFTATLLCASSSACQPSCQPSQSGSCQGRGRNTSQTQFILPATSGDMPTTSWKLQTALKQWPTFPMRFRNGQRQLRTQLMQPYGSNILLIP